MALSKAPKEIILNIADELDDPWVSGALARITSELYYLLNRHLYHQDVAKPLSKLLTWAAENGVEDTVQKAVDIGRVGISIRSQKASTWLFKILQIVCALLNSS
jgi:hypothetical protein